LILHTNVTHGINDSNQTNHAWMIWNQQHPNMTYKVPLLFTKYACCTCEWRCVKTCVNIKLSLFLHVLILLKKYHSILWDMVWIWSWRFSCHVCRPYLFAHLWQWIWWGIDWWISFWRTTGCWYMWVYDTGWYFPQCEKKVGSQPTFKFIHPHEEFFFQMGDIMQEIINEVKKVGFNS
jgi:hypothetical protein